MGLRGIDKLTGTPYNKIQIQWNNTTNPALEMTNTSLKQCQRLFYVYMSWKWITVTATKILKDWFTQITNNAPKSLAFVCLLSSAVFIDRYIYEEKWAVVGMCYNSIIGEKGDKCHQNQ